MDAWGPEDEAVGHYRRYRRESLAQLCRRSGLESIGVRSVGVPTVNALFGVGMALLHASGGLANLPNGKAARTRASGLQRFPFKTVFPPAFRHVLNPLACAPLFAIQRRFYDSDLGLILLAAGRVPGRTAAPAASSNGAVVSARS
jgi:hypothetical protein